MSLPEKQIAVRWYPPSYDIRVESAPVPDILDPDDAIVKVTLAGLCGSDLHVYRGSGITKDHTSGHEFLGEVIKLGSNFGKNVSGRPALYSTLKVGDKVVAPFTVNCGECHVCRLGYTGRCPSGVLFGSPLLEGGQAQFVRVPKAGGTLYNLSDPQAWSLSVSDKNAVAAISSIADSSLLLLSDILPTGVFAALQTLNHPKVQPMLTGKAWPNSCLQMTSQMPLAQDLLLPEDKMLNFAIVGSGPVGICAAVSLLDMLARNDLDFRIVAIDPNESRRQKMLAVYNVIPKEARGKGEFVVQDIEEAKETMKGWTNGIGATAVLEIVGNNSALTLAYDLVRAFGAIISVGVHGSKEMPFTGIQLYNKNVSFDFGRCPARSMFPMAVEVLVRRQDVFGKVGTESSLIDKIVGFDEAKEIYEDFDKGRIGKVLFDPWK